MWCSYVAVSTQSLLGRNRASFNPSGLTESLSLAVHAFASRMLMSVSVDETLLCQKPADMLFWEKNVITTYIHYWLSNAHTDTHTNTHTYTYIYMCVCVCVCLYVSGHIIKLGKYIND